MTKYTQGCRKVFFLFASPRAAVAEPAYRLVRGLRQIIASIFYPRLLQQRLHAHRRVVAIIVRDMS